MIKAIETRYKGYRFRSRLEARWAVFFDALGVQWEYEPEGFELPSGARYLPDFRVQDPRGGYVWFEVKPLLGDEAKAAEMDRSVDSQLGYFGSGHVYMLIGEPRIAAHPRANDKDEFVTFLCDDKYGPLYYSFGEASNAEDWIKWIGEWNLGLGGLDQAFREVHRAVHAARGARFEHGESGARA